MQYAQSTGSTPSFDDGGVLLNQRNLWLTAIRAGLTRKREVYAKGALECLNFYLGDHSYLFKPDYIMDEQMFLEIESSLNDDKPARMPKFRISDNWAAKCVQIYAPYLTQGALIRMVKSVQAYAPMPIMFGVDSPQTQQMKYQMMGDAYLMQQQQAQLQMSMAFMQLEVDSQVRNARADMMQRMLQYHVKELGLEKERRCLVEEAIVLGFGALHTEIISMPGSQNKLIGSNFVKAEDIVWDPDAAREKDAKWLAIQCRMPAWLFSRIYGIPETEIKPKMASTTSVAIHGKMTLDAGGEKNVRDHNSCDEVVYWKVFSRMGNGARLQPATQREPVLDQLDREMGDFCFFVVTDSVDYPANFTPMLFQQVQQQVQMQMQQAQMNPMVQVQNPIELLRQAASWITPYYMDVDQPWPICTLGFHFRNDSPYPIPHLQFCLSYLKFMVWAISFIADKAYRSQRDIWLIDKQISEQLKKAIEEGDDECVVEMAKIDQKTLDQFVKIISAPELKNTIVEIYKFFEQKVEQMSGLSDILQATMDRQMRSATEARVTSDAAQLRPRDMLAMVNALDTMVARKEAIASIFHYLPQDVAPVLGDQGARAWQQLFTNADPLKVMRESEYSVVAGPGRVLDLATREDQTNQMVATVLPTMVTMGMQVGSFEQANAVLREWAEARQIDPKMVQFPNPMPPPPPEQGDGGKGVASPPAQKSKETK